MTLADLAAEVDQDAVLALLSARPPGLLDDGSPEADRFERATLGIAAQVAAITGSAPEGARRALAVEAITVGVGARIEYSAFPEQQGPGDLGRAAQLRAEFLALLAMLRDWTGGDDGDDGEGGIGDGIPSPRGSFPDARAYPDPVEYC